MGSGPARWFAIACVLFGVSLAKAEPAEGPAPDDRSNVVAARALYGRNIERIEVVFDPPRWVTNVSVRRVRPGQRFTAETARIALDELAVTGRFGELRAEAVPHGDGVLLRLVGTARRVVTGIRITGFAGDTEELVRSLGVRVGGEITARDVPHVARRLEERLARRGYPDARVVLRTFDTDDPLSVVLVFEVAAFAPARIASLKFQVWPDPKQPELVTLLADYGVDRGQRADVEAIEAADRELEARLRAAGYHDAEVKHELVRAPHGMQLVVRVVAGSRVVLRFEGNRRFDAATLTSGLELDTSSDRSPSAFAERVRRFYVERGFYDAVVEPRLRGNDGDPVRELVLRIHEGDPVRVVAREYPCLVGGERSPDDIGSEIDSFLAELPGGSLAGPVDGALVDALHGPRRSAWGDPAPYDPNPWSTYDPATYERALDHLEDLLRSEGYLRARVGPVTVLRRRCDPRVGGRCVPLGTRASPPPACGADEAPPSPPELACTPDLAKSRRCEPEVVLSIPIRLGPRTVIESIVIEGAHEKPLSSLVAATGLVPGEPVSELEIDRARRRLLDAYAEDGFAFAEVSSELVPSQDGTRAQVRFLVNERKRVRVSRIELRGARITSESLIRGRIALEPGGVYSRSLVRRTEEHLATLGVFSSVSVGLEDPYVPASEKVVVVSVQERKPQYLDIRPGFSTGEGFRIGFEYAHRNIAGQAIRLTLRSQLGYLPLGLILEEDVRDKYRDLGVGDRLERRNTATVEFPEIGLGPLFRMSLEGVDVRDNARDFGLTKDAGIATLTFLPERRVSIQLAASVERNVARIFGEEQKGALDEYLRMNPSQRNAFRVPEGTTFVVAERIAASWDRRDKPLDATRGTFVSASLEHVAARPVEEEAKPVTESTSVFQAVRSRFLRIQNRLGAYLPIGGGGVSLALSFRWGLNQQLTQGSRTYPDRLFFLGGVDSLRGFLQDSLVPEDVAARLLDPSSGLRIEQVVIRGGDTFINPRAELRLPLSETIRTALFVDAGNLWADARSFAPTKLRYSAGTGIRIATPIGPLAFDYGFNLERVLDRLDPSRPRQRYWESLGAFHFSVGLF